MYFSVSFHNPSNIPGQGVLIIREPLVSGSTSLPVSSTTSISNPGIGNVAEPGFNGIVSIPGKGLINIPPVSVCHHVSIIGHFFFPITLKYHFQTSGLIGSPTVPSKRKVERLNEFGISSPNFINIRSAVGVV